MPRFDESHLALCIPPTVPAVLCVRHMGPADLAAITAHFVGLSLADRELRFCQQRSDAQLAAYVQGLDFARDPVLGAFAQSRLLGVCHLGFGPVREGVRPVAELGISVDLAERGLRVGAELVNAAFVAAVERDCADVYIYYVQHNHRMHGMCVRLGAEIERERGECTARIPLTAHWHGDQLIGVTAGSRHLHVAGAQATA
jgi:RimJ/RimL family protein N-acetyltransferase